MTANEYDAAGRLVNLTHTAADETLLSSYSYELDGVGNRVRVTETLTGTTRVIDYVYDPLNRLTSADYSTGESYEYTYDAVGNRTTMTTTSPLAETTVTTYTYDAANRLLVTESPGHLVSYAWDDRGNLVNDGTFTYVYNAAGRMVRAESVTATLVFTYNANGLRVAQSVIGFGEPAGDVTNFAWDWASGLPEMLSEGGNLYLVGHETPGQWDGSTWAYYLPDALGSIRQTTDDAGSVTSAREWTPYGVEVGTAQVGLGYTGEWWDGSAGMLYLRARWYEPVVGRFTQRDPWEGDKLHSQTLNGFLYADGNPINRIDPSGLCALVGATDCERFVSEIRGMVKGLRDARECHPWLKFASEEEQVLDFLAWYYSGIPFNGLALGWWPRQTKFTQQGDSDRWTVPTWSAQKTKFRLGSSHKPVWGRPGANNARALRFQASIF